MTLAVVWVKTLIQCKLTSRWRWTPLPTPFFVVQRNKTCVRILLGVDVTSFAWPYLWEEDEPDCIIFIRTSLPPYPNIHLSFLWFYIIVFSDLCQYCSNFHVTQLRLTPLSAAFCNNVKLLTINCHYYFCRLHCPYYFTVPEKFIPIHLEK